MSVLSSPLRRQLETSVLSARRAAESASRAAVDALGVFADRRPGHLTDSQAVLRRALRAKSRQLGWEAELLVAECAYEQWHRLLFARFLADNGLLLHPDYEVSVTLAECEELAEGLDEPDGWSVAARFAAQILPGIFRLDDPCVQLRLAPEGRHALEQILDAIPAETFAAEDALGWVYQFWQKEKKDSINASERKVVASDLGPVTQLFTENYMVRFLLENSLGAWWAARNPASPLIESFKYLRLDEAGSPEAGSFGSWPKHVAEVTVMDPCCGSGHFLVAAFSMLCQMRAEEEGLATVDAQDAVLRENLFGLELDPRCVQIALFAVALQAWKAGGGWRKLPTPNIACSGIPVKAPVEEWTALAGDDQRLALALGQLHTLFREADTLGSLITPWTELDAASEQISTADVDWNEMAPTIAIASNRETLDPAARVLGSEATSLMVAADLLARRYTLLVTNVPYLARAKQPEALQRMGSDLYSEGRADLATMFVLRIGALVAPGGSEATVTPQNWLYLTNYTKFRHSILTKSRLDMVARIGSGATASKSWDTLRALTIASHIRPSDSHEIVGVDTIAPYDEQRSIDLRTAASVRVTQSQQLSNPDARIVFAKLGDTPLLETVAASLQGISPADTARFRRYFWEIDLGARWVPWQRPVSRTEPYGGRDSALDWGKPLHEAVDRGDAFIRGQAAWKKRGVAVRQVGDLPATLYTGERFDTSCAVIVPRDQKLVPALWAFVSSPQFSSLVREIDRKLNVTNATLAKIPFDVQHWSAVAKELGPLPEAASDDPTQWLFAGRPEKSTAPLQVAVARLVGYGWPEQPDDDDLVGLADTDGIVCLPPVAGERPAAERLQDVLSTAYGGTWAPARVKELLEEAGSKKGTLSDWLRDEFFKQHCAVFGNRPFIWHISDGRRDGFSVLVNYHRLDRRALEKLTYTYLGQDWLERQSAEVAEGVAGAQGRHEAAQKLQGRLESILKGEAPYDIYVRWKGIDRQPIGWDPDVNDGVRINIRPFVEAGVLRSRFNVKWGKDRGKNPDGSERRNDLHLALAQKRAAESRGS